MGRLIIFRRGDEGTAPRRGFEALKKRKGHQDPLSPPREDRGRRWLFARQEGGPCEHRICWHRDLGLFGRPNCGKRLLVKPPGYGVWLQRPTLIGI